MNRIRQFIQKWGTPGNLTAAGFLLVAAGFVPFLLLGKGSVITVNDQLDGEIFTYIFQAKYLFSGQDIIREWMGGIGKEALFPPSMLTVLFYKILPALAAFLVNQFLVSITAFLGMNAFVRRLTQNGWLALAAALLFAYLPFYSVYGLTVAGIPMLAAAFLDLMRLREIPEEENRKKRMLQSTGLVAFYGLMSSFVLLGYAVCGILAVLCVILLLRRDRRQYGGVYLAAGLLAGWYAAGNRSLIAQVLGIGASEISHKTEYVLRGLPFWDSFWSMLVSGSGHAPSYHGWLLLPVTAALVIGFLVRNRMDGKQRREWGWMGCFWLAALLTAVFYGWFHTASAVALRQSLGGFFVYFQLDRIYWFYPFLWYSMLALATSLLFGIVKRTAGWKRYAGCGLVAALLVTACFQVLWHSDLKRNVRQLLGPESSNAVTWDKYYGEEIFRQIAERIARPQEDYRVGSVALNPAAAAYNGFDTVDGYSNNYSLAYKHAFREVIAGELEKDAEIKRYFDEWGNRCYLFTAQLGQNYYYEKDTQVTLSGLDWNMEALRALGCEYLFSGVEITDANRMGMRLLDSFEAKESDCRYRIWVYECSP